MVNNPLGMSEMRLSSVDSKSLPSGLTSLPFSATSNPRPDTALTTHPTNSMSAIIAEQTGQAATAVLNERVEDSEQIALDGEQSGLEAPLPADFRPFFVLIENPETGEHHHPNVHYVFSDDDPDLLTTANLMTLDATNDAGGSNAGFGTEIDADRLVIVDMQANGSKD